MFTGRFTSSDLESYLKSYFEDETKDKTADERMETQDIKTGDVEGGDGMSAPLIYSHIVSALQKNEIHSKKIISIVKDIAAANGDDISDDLAKKMVGDEK